MNNKTSYHSRAAQQYSPRMRVQRGGMFHPSEKPKFLIKIFEGTSVDFAKWIEDTENEQSGYAFHSHSCVSALRNERGTWSTMFVYSEEKARRDELARREKTGRWRKIIRPMGDYLVWTTLPVDKWREFPKGVEDDIFEINWPVDRPKPPVDEKRVQEEWELYTY